MKRSLLRLVSDDYCHCMLTLPNAALLNQFIRYVGVGGTAFIVDFGCLFALTEYAGLHYLVAATIAFCVGLTTSYVLCLVWVFDFRRMENRLHEFLVFGAIGIAGLLLNNLLLWLLTDLVGFHYLLSKVFSAAFILFFNFGLRRWMLFSSAVADPHQKESLP